jgi:glycosyltransferase involved in cell wall biosynthesis
MHGPAAKAFRNTDLIRSRPKTVTPPRAMKLSIVIPFFNEAATLGAILDKVLAVQLPGVTKEIIAVNDGSRDGSEKIAARYAGQHPDEVRLLSFASNGGKGCAVIAGLAEATGEVVIVQDADLEYEPEDYRAILDAYKDPSVKVVFGSRVLGAQRHICNGASDRRSYHRYYWGGRLVTLATNLIYAAHLTDEPTCYKSLRRDVLDELELSSKGFEFCPEITAKILRRGYQIVEVPIHYYPRSFEEGKKIRYSDGLKAIWTLLRLRWD